MTGPNESKAALAGDLAVEAATRDDLDLLVRLEQDSFSAPWTRKMFEAELEGNPFSRLLVARRPPDRGGAPEVVGYVCFWLVFEELRLMNLAVAPAARRRGVARALVRRALAQGLAGGATRAVLEVRASNVAARRLYEAEGFTTYAVRAKYYRDPIEDALLMSLEPLDRSRAGSGPGEGPAGKLALAVGHPDDDKIAQSEARLGEEQARPTGTVGRPAGQQLGGALRGPVPDGAGTRSMDAPSTGGSR